MSLTYEPTKKFHPVANLFPLMKDIDPERWVEFCSSVRDEGLLEPIVCIENEIIDGRHRYLACIETNTPPRFVQFSTLGVKVPPHIYAFDRNFQRRDLTADQRVQIYQAFLEFDQKEALDRRAEQGKSVGRGRKKLVANSAQANSRDNRAPTSRAKLAAAARVSEHKAQQAMNVAKAAPELAEKVKRGELTLVDASKHAVAKRDGSQIRSFADIKLKNEPVDPVARIMRQVHKLSRINFIALTSHIRAFAAHVYPDMSCAMPAEPNKDVAAMAREALPPQLERENDGGVNAPEGFTDNAQPMPEVRG